MLNNTLSIPAMPHYKGLEWEVKLRPGAALDFWTGVVTGAGGNNHHSRLFTAPAAGETEFVVNGNCFHKRRLAGARQDAPLSSTVTLSF